MILISIGTFIGKIKQEAKLYFILDKGKLDINKLK